MKKLNKMTDEDKQKTLDKWEPLLDKLDISEDRKSWISQYAELQENNSIYGMNATQSSNSFQTIISPIVTRIAAQTIFFGDSKLLEEAKKEVVAENRDRHIDSILNDADYVPVVLEETNKYKEYRKSGLLTVQPMSAPTGMLFYLDYVYKPKKIKFRRKGYYAKKKKIKKPY